MNKHDELNAYTFIVAQHSHRRCRARQNASAICALNSDTTAIKTIWMMLWLYMWRYFFFMTLSVLFACTVVVVVVSVRIGGCGARSIPVLQPQQR